MACSDKKNQKSSFYSKIFIFHFSYLDGWSWNSCFPRRFDIQSLSTNPNNAGQYLLMSLQQCPTSEWNSLQWLTLYVNAICSGIYNTKRKITRLCMLLIVLLSSSMNLLSLKELTVSASVTIPTQAITGLVSWAGSGLTEHFTEHIQLTNSAENSAFFVGFILCHINQLREDSNESQYNWLVVPSGEFGQLLEMISHKFGFSEQIYPSLSPSKGTPFC